MMTALVRGVRAWRRLVARAKNPGRIRWDDAPILGGQVRVARGRTLTIAEDVSVGPNFTCMTHGLIGPGSMLSAEVAFIGLDHDFSDPGVRISCAPLLEPARTHLEGNNFVGFGATILGNVRIGQGAIVAARALVLADVPPGAVVAGVPARIVRRRE